MGRGAELKVSLSDLSDLLDFREAELSVLSSLQRDRVMEARFDVYMIKLLNIVRAFDDVMFRREAWVERSMLNIRANGQVMPYGQGGPAQGAPICLQISRP